MKKYEIIDHTADVGLRVFGKDLSELFINAASGMFKIITDAKNAQADQTINIRLKAPNIEELFLLWLSELLYQSNVKEIIFTEFVIESLSDKSLKAYARAYKFDIKKESLNVEIKAVTYHQLKVEKTGDGYFGQVIFDI